MTSTQDKILCFEYLIYSLSKWYGELNPKENPIEPFTRLKSLKLLFFVSAVNATEYDKKLLSIFDNFYAMQHGPVESDIYNAMIHSNMRYFDYKERITTLKEDIKLNDSLFECLPKMQKSLVDEAVETLKKTNTNFILNKPFDLVDISHKWSSWKVAFEIANILGKRSEIMSIEDICIDIKHFD